MRTTTTTSTTRWRKTRTVREPSQAQRGGRRRISRTEGREGWAQGTKWRRRWWNPWAWRGRRRRRRRFDGWVEGRGGRKWQDREDCLGRGGERDGEGGIVAPQPLCRKMCTPLWSGRRWWWRYAPAPPRSTGTSFFFVSLGVTLPNWSRTSSQTILVLVPAASSIRHGFIIYFSFIPFFHSSRSYTFSFHLLYPWSVLGWQSWHFTGLKSSP